MSKDTENFNCDLIKKVCILMPNQKDFGYSFPCNGLGSQIIQYNWINKFYEIIILVVKYK